MKILYFHQHFSTPKGSAGIRSYAMAQSLIRNGHQVTMVCGSFGAGQTGLTEPFKSGVRKGNVDGIDIIEFELPYSNSLSFLKRILIFLSFAFKSIKVALFEKYRRTILLINLTLIPIFLWFFLMVLWNILHGIFSIQSFKKSIIIGLYLIVVNKYKYKNIDNEIDEIGQNGN